MIIVSTFALRIPATSTVNASAVGNTAITVGATYYGGNYDEVSHSWVIDNQNQCTRIANGEFSAASLAAIVSSSCNDDNGLGYQNDIPLHNTVSYAELSNNPANPDYSALGNLAAGTRLEIKYQGRCVVAEKRDVGTGGGPVNGYPRAIDLWWQTARSLGFTNGFDTVSVKLAGSGTPLTPLGSSTSCSTSTPVTSTPVAPVSSRSAGGTSNSSNQSKASTTSAGSVNSTSPSATSSGSTSSTSQKSPQKPKTPSTIANIDSSKKDITSSNQTNSKANNLRIGYNDRIRKLSTSSIVFSIFMITTIIIMLHHSLKDFRNVRIRFSKNLNIA